VYQGERYHFCSDGCKDIFDNEPEKYIQAWLPMPGLMQDPLNGDLAGWMDWVFLKNGEDNGDYATSQDKHNFELWRSMASSNQ
jgi:phenol hydroxylase P3 protein